MNTEIESIKTLNDTEVKDVSPIRQLEGMVSLQPFYVDDNAILFCGASEKVLPLLPANSVDLTVTSPPYDNLRTYKGFTFDFETIAKELYRVTKDGGVVVWVVNDATIDGSETLTSCKQKIFFREQCGFNIHDTMMYKKQNGGIAGSTLCYLQYFEYMFILSKGRPKVINLIRDRKNVVEPREKLEAMGRRFENGEKKGQRVIKRYEFGVRTNIWEYSTGNEEVDEHPAIYPEQLAKDHILSWSNEGDTVLDCFSGSGTTMKAAKLLKRNSIGIEIAKEYCELTVRRINKPMPLFNGLTS